MGVWRGEGDGFASEAVEPGLGPGGLTPEAVPGVPAWTEGGLWDLRGVVGDLSWSLKGRKVMGRQGGRRWDREQQPRRVVGTEVSGGCVTGRRWGRVGR